MTGPLPPMLPPCVYPLVEKQGASGAILCIHPGGLPPRSYKELSKVFTDKSIYVADLSMHILFIEGGYPKSDPEGAIQAIAKDVQEALAGSTDLPLTALCGWSFGGVLAHEVALQRANAGLPPVPLMVIDSIAPVDKYPFDWIFRMLSASRLAASAGEQKHLATWFTQYLNTLKSSKISVSKRDAMVMDEDRLIETLLQEAIAAGAFPEGTSAAGFGKIYKEFKRGMQRNRRLLAEYTPRGPRQDVLLIRAQSPFFPIFRLFHAMGWGALARNLTVLSLPGNHYQLMADVKLMRRMARLLQTYMTTSQIAH